MTVKTLTERDAWLLLAKEWDDEARGDGGAWTEFGMCRALTDLYQNRDKIDIRTLDCMRARLQQHKPRGARNGGYWWDFSKDGLRKRANYCRKMAGLCKPERKKVKRAKQRS